LAIEAGGDIVVAGSNDPFNVFVWSIKTAQLVDILSGHTGPISSLSFSPANGMLTSSSWDHSVKVWDIFGKNGLIESFDHNSEVI
jgi:periodic tryptophan protein 2